MTLYFFRSFHLQSWIIRAVIRVFLCFANISSSSILYLLKVKVVNYEVYEMIYMRGGDTDPRMNNICVREDGELKMKTREKKSEKTWEREKKMFGGGVWRAIKSIHAYPIKSNNSVQRTHR